MLHGKGSHEREPWVSSSKRTHLCPQNTTVSSPSPRGRHAQHPASSTQYNRTSQHESIRHLSNSRLPLTNLPARETVRTSRNCNPARVAFTLPTREPVAMGNRSNGSLPLCSQSHHLNMPGTVYQWEGRATSGVTGAGLARTRHHPEYISKIRNGPAFSGYPIQTALPTNGPPGLG